jgi:deazaflavin-dependent oxidoreductase (nitroreductase family)
VDREEILRKNKANMVEFRSNGGRLTSFGDAPLLLLTTSGARSGQSHTNPVMYLADEHDSNRVYIFAAYAGSDSHPAWFHNLVANPQEVGIEIGSDTLTANAEVIPEPRRSEVYAVQASRHPRFADYQTMTTRPIPVIAITLNR